MKRTQAECLTVSYRCLPAYWVAVQFASNNVCCERWKTVEMEAKLPNCESLDAASLITATWDGFADEYVAPWGYSTEWLFADGCLSCWDCPLTASIWSKLTIMHVYRKSITLWHFVIRNWIPRGWLFNISKHIMSGRKLRGVLVIGCWTMWLRWVSMIGEGWTAVSRGGFLAEVEGFMLRDSVSD